MTNFTNNVSLHNRFDFEIIDSKSKNVIGNAQAENIICDSLWKRLCGLATYFSYVQYGDGSGTPATTDVSLFSRIGYLSYTEKSYTCDPFKGTASVTKKFVINETTANGKEITEIGLAYSTSDGYLVTHAMIKDMNGNPITLTKNDTMIVNVYATVYLSYNPNGWDNGHIRLFMNQYSYLTQWLLGDYSVIGSTDGGYSYWGYKGTVNADPVVLPNRNGTDGGVMYADIKVSGDPANKTITVSASRAASNMCNEARGIACVTADRTLSVSESSLWGNCWMALNVGGSWYPYTSITADNIGTGDGSKTEFKTSFDFPYDATIYVNGVERNDVNVTKTRCGRTYIGDMFQLIHNSGAYNYYSSSTGQRPKTPPLILGDVANKSASICSMEKGSYSVYYNTAYSYGISKIEATNIAKVLVECSNNFTDWTTITTPGSIPATYQKYKYWKFTAIEADTSNQCWMVVTSANAYPEYNVVFTTPPASGAIITADYKAEVIAKTVDSVFDVSVEISLSGE